MDLAPLYLNKNRERRLRAGHLWVYSNEVDAARSPLPGFQPGQQVQILAHNGKPLGNGYVNPHTLICGRLVSRDPRYSLDSSLLTHRIKVALSLRERLWAKPYYRLLHGEGDAVPGLVVDRFGDVLVAQFNTAGMQAAGEAVVAALDKVLKPRAILLRNDSPLRLVEGLGQEIEDALGTAPDRLTIEENGCRFLVSPRQGQKTGWYFDHRENRARMQRLARGQRVLDLFSYTGAWGLQAAAAGAEKVTLVEASAPSQERALENAAENGLAERVEALTGDAFALLKQLRAERRRFDLVIADPPAFIKRRKDQKTGLEAYQRLNRMAMQVLERDGLLVSASCSYHLGREQLRELLLSGARHLDRSLQLIGEGHQGADHPVHPAIPESDYIKCLFGRVLPA
jgi:23S rRNA (cytosine1962-C5)-methyltransferase